MFLLAGCAQGKGEPTPAGSLEKARAAQDAVLRYIDRVNVYDLQSALALSGPDYAEATRRQVTEYQQRGISRKPDRLIPPDHCTESELCRIAVTGQALVEGRVIGQFQSEFAMGYLDGRWVVISAIGDHITAPGP
jgi:hypothetical protein